MRTPFTMDSAGFLALLDALERRFNEVTAAASLSFAGIDGDLYPVVQPARAGEEDCADRGESAAAEHAIVPRPCRVQQIPAPLPRVSERVEESVEVR